MAQSTYLRAHEGSFHCLDTGHFSIHYLHAGSGRPLILIHGGGMWLYSYRHTTKSLSENFSVHALDMPGYGRSRLMDPALPMDSSTMALALKEFMDSLGLGRASLVGHSWGGGWALAYALDHPERVDRIVLINSSGLDVPDVFEWELLKIPVVGSMLLRFLTLSMVRKRLELSFYRKGMVDDAMALEVLLPLKIPENRKAQASLARNLSWAGVERRLDELDHQVLLIWGEMDRYLDKALITRFRDRIRNLKAAIIPDCGHSAHEEAPEIVNGLITDFLKGG